MSKVGLNYTVVAGCSFMEGAEIENPDGTPAGKDYRFSKLLADTLETKEVCLAKSGASNRFIVESVYTWLRDNPNELPVVVIGLTGITRMHLKSNWSPEVLNLPILDLLYVQGDVSESKLHRRKMAKLVTGDEDKVSELKEWARFTVENLFDLDFHRQKLQYDVFLLAKYMESRDIPYIIFNSLEDNIQDIKYEINYFSFPIKPRDFIVSPRNIDGMQKRVIEDTWLHYISQNQQKLHGQKYMHTVHCSTVPPYGEWFCGGHPSPKANEDLLKLLLPEIKNQLRIRHSKLKAQKKTKLI